MIQGLGFLPLPFPLAAAKPGHLNPGAWSGELVSGRPQGREEHKDPTHTAAALGPQRPSRVEGIWGPESSLSYRQQHPPPRAQTANGPEPGVRVPGEQLEGNRICWFIDCGWSGRPLTQSQLFLLKSTGAGLDFYVVLRSLSFPIFQMNAPEEMMSEDCPCCCRWPHQPCGQLGWQSCDTPGWGLASASAMSLTCYGACEPQCPLW